MSNGKPKLLPEKLIQLITRNCMLKRLIFDSPTGRFSKNSNFTFQKSKREKKYSKYRAVQCILQSLEKITCQCGPSKN